MNLYKIGAVAAQLASYLATFVFVSALLPTLPFVWLFSSALVAEMLLTLAKNAIFNGQYKRAKQAQKSVGWSAVILDALLNAGGIFPLTLNLANTPTVLMLSTTFGLKSEISGLSALGLALLAGYGLSALPNYLWCIGSAKDKDDD
jgi:hypothetical protein